MTLNSSTKSYLHRSKSEEFEELDQTKFRFTSIGCYLSLRYIYTRYSYTQFLSSYTLVFLIALCQYVVMVCIYCNSKTSIINSRNQVKPNNKWRRRQCSKCSSTVTTIETVDYSKAIVVIDRKNKTKDFIRDKLFLSVYAACKHRKNSITCADALTETIIIKIINNLDDASIHTDTIQNLVKTVLKDFDNSAYVQYLAYHN